MGMSDDLVVVLPQYQQQPSNGPVPNGVLASQKKQNNRDIIFLRFRQKINSNTQRARMERLHTNDSPQGVTVTWRPWLHVKRAARTRRRCCSRMAEKISFRTPRTPYIHKCFKENCFNSRPYKYLVLLVHLAHQPRGKSMDPISRLKGRKEARQGHQCQSQPSS